MRKDTEMAKKQRRAFTSEQKAHGVAAYHECKDLSQVGRDFGISPSVIGAWVKQARIDTGDADADSGPTTKEQTEIERFRPELRKMERERDFLKRRLPSSQQIRREVRVDRGGEGELPNRDDVSVAGSLDERVLRLASKDEADGA